MHLKKKSKRDVSSGDDSENKNDRLPLQSIEGNSQLNVKSKTLKVDEFIDKMSCPQQKQCQELLAKAIYASGKIMK